MVSQSIVEPVTAPVDGFFFGLMRQSISKPSRSSASSSGIETSSKYPGFTTSVSAPSLEFSWLIQSPAPDLSFSVFLYLNASKNVVPLSVPSWPSSTTSTVHWNCGSSVNVAPSFLRVTVRARCIPVRQRA
jgi:hypothetical protein